MKGINYTATTETWATQTTLTNHRAELKQKIPTFCKSSQSNVECRTMKSHIIIYIYGYNLFTNSTSGHHKNAKLLKDKQFEK